ncbi:MAG: hypothetical protein JNK49_12500 [Planctomycetes bacterium]|nr:hypothetical protein [Planctomycetota bacterium]
MQCHKCLSLSALLTVALASGCRSGPSYKLPVGGVAATDPCGLQVLATKVDTGRSNFVVVFDLANDGDNGLLVPIADLEGMWGDQVARVTVDARALRKNNTCVVPKMPGTVDQGMFEGTHWVTGSTGGMAGGEAVWIRGKSRVSGVKVTCAVPQQPGQALMVRWPRIYAGDAQGTVQATVANNFTWSMSPVMPAESGN